MILPRSVLSLVGDSAVIVQETSKVKAAPVLQSRAFGQRQDMASVGVRIGQAILRSKVDVLDQENTAAASYMLFRWA